MSHRSIFYDTEDKALRSCMKITENPSEKTIHTKSGTGISV